MGLDYKLFKEWPERAKSRMKELSMTQDMLAKQMSVTRSAIGHYLAGRRTPHMEQFQKLAEILKVDLIWLQFGIDTNKNPELANKYLPETNPLPSPIPILTWKQVANEDLQNLDKLNPEYLPNLYTDKLNLYALRIKGDTMTSPSGHMIGFREGDIIQVDPCEEPKDGDFVVAVLPGANEATFKQYVIDGGIRYLKPLNPQYPLITIDDKTKICGVATYSIGTNYK